MAVAHEDDGLAREYAAHARLYDADVLEKCLQDMEARAGRSDVSWESGAWAASVIRRAIEEGRPFAMVRVGDGTGNLLGYADPTFSTLRRHSLDQILSMTFGTSDFTEADIDRIRAGLVEAIRSADMLGVSDRFRLGRLRTIDQEVSGEADVRGYSGSRESYVAIAELMRHEGVRPPYLVTNHMHRFLAPHMAEVIGGLDRVCVIGPYDLGERISARFGLGAVTTHRIPNQNSTSGQGGRWFPDIFEDLMESIDPARDGRVHLVAAGLLAKPLCARIKACGGVALDIGSLIDVWAGRGVRRYQDDAFVAAHAL